MGTGKLQSIMTMHIDVCLGRIRLDPDTVTLTEALAFGSFLDGTLLTIESPGKGGSVSGPQSLAHLTVMLLSASGWQQRPRLG